MTSLPPRPGDEGDSNNPQDPAAPASPVSPSPSPLGSLSQLRDSQMRLSVLLEAIEITPDDLDAQAEEVHERIVRLVYLLMSKEVAQTCASRWDMPGQRRLGERFEAAADKWPAYREALAELKSAREERRSAVAALRELEAPRREYISELRRFYDEFSDTLDFLFPR